MKKYFLFCIVASLTTVLKSQTITVEMRTDSWPTEISWQISQNSSVIHSRSAYSYTSPNTTSSETFTLSVGTYTINLNDGYGDGIVTPGYIRIIQNGSVLFQKGGGVPEGNYATTFTGSFTVAGVDPCANNTLPTVNLSASSSTIIQGNSVTLNATASDANGTISKVEFYHGATKIGEDLSSPYSLNTTPTTTGTFSYSAKAIDNCNGIGTSNTVNVSVTSSNPCSNNVSPTVALTQPSNAQVFTTGSTVSLAANASDANGTIAYVRFYQNGTQIAEDATNPYLHSIGNIQIGTYNISAIAFDNCGAQSGSSAVSITVNNPTSGGTTGQWTTAGSGIYHLNDVHIGKSNTNKGSETEYKLFVAGGLKAEKFKLEIGSTGGWADYVFDEKYKLMPISKLKTYISENKHLPGFPSEKSIMNNEGYEMGDMIKRQQEAIEHLHLYIIQLEDKIAKLEKLIHKVK